jgi:hypothetical protein
MVMSGPASDDTDVLIDAPVVEGLSHDVGLDGYLLIIDPGRDFGARLALFLTRYDGAGLGTTEPGQISTVASTGESRSPGH